MSIVFAWVNPIARADGTVLAATDIGSSVVSQVNADGSLTPTATVTGDGTTVTVAAPTTAGTYVYQVHTVDTNGVIGAPSATASVVVPVPVDSSPPVAPTSFTATLQ